jgi:hypothetical protein
MSTVTKGSCALKSKAEPVIRDAATAGLVQCRLCSAGFRRVDSVHIGMIPDMPCDRVFTSRGEGADTTAQCYISRDQGGLMRVTGKSITDEQIVEYRKTLGNVDASYMERNSCDVALGRFSIGCTQKMIRKARISIARSIRASAMKGK